MRAYAPRPDKCSQCHSESAAKRRQMLRGHEGAVVSMQNTQKYATYQSLPPRANGNTGGVSIIVFGHGGFARKIGASRKIARGTPGVGGFRAVTATSFTDVKAHAATSFAENQIRSSSLARNLAVCPFCLGQLSSLCRDDFMTIQLNPAGCQQFVGMPTRQPAAETKN